MRNRWKRLAVIMSVAALLVCQNEVIEVRAEEEPKTEEGVLLEETKNNETTAQKYEDKVFEKTKIQEPELNNGETDDGRRGSTEAGDGVIQIKETEKELDKVDMEGQQARDEERGKSTLLLPVEDLKLDDDEHPKSVSFIIPNEKGTAAYSVEMWHNGSHWGDLAEFDDKEKGENVELTWGNLWSGGKYKISVTTFDTGGEPKNQVFTKEWEFTEPDEHLPIPQNISWSEGGILSFEVPENEYVGYFRFNIYSHYGQEKEHQIYSPEGEGIEGLITESEGVVKFKLNEYVESHLRKTVEKGYCVEVMAVSRDTSIFGDSDWSDKVMFGGGSAEPVSPPSDDNRDDGDSSSGQESKSSSDNLDDSYITEPVEEWKPITPDEIKRYAVYGREKTVYTADKGNAYDITIQNAMQGKQCFDSFEAVLDDWTIGRTYNIFPSAKSVYKMDSKARITLNIPKTLQMDGREFQMICVTEKGQPIILEDLDTNSETVTFETDRYYAFALVYRDAAVTQ